MKPIGIFGSIIIDLVTVADRLPALGETLPGKKFKLLFGGKGANEAVAVRRLGVPVMMFGAVGSGYFSYMALKNLKKEKVNIKNVHKIKGSSVGMSAITIVGGNNSIICTPNANMQIEEEHFNSMKKDILKCGVIGSQLEVPATIIKKIVALAKANGIKFVFNPSPMINYPAEIFKNSDFIIVNEVEITQIKGYNKKQPFALLEKFPKKLILTKGKEGVYIHDGAKLIHIPAIEVKATDTTGAGDTFMGAFMLKLNEGADPVTACRYANVAAGLKTTKLGAQTGMPNVADVLQYTEKNGIIL